MRTCEAFSPDLTLKASTKTARQLPIGLKARTPNYPQPPTGGRGRGPVRRMPVA
ncbi:hypothetical protein GCM10023080_005540 [Streptomyces pseudoechinosporeus]